MSSIIGLRALKDNYIWVIQEPQSTKIIVVDPGEAKPVLDYIKTHDLNLAGILITHHHWDHTNGIQDLLKHFPDIPVYSSFVDKVEGVTHTVQDADEIHFDHLAMPIQVLGIPGHTLGHTAYLYDKALFSGDMLFSVGAGKNFEGTILQMMQSLHKLKQLPKETLLYCGHEYTLSNITFAQKVEPNNLDLAQRKKEVEALVSQGLPSLPVTLESELNTNPFLRWDTLTVIEAAERHAQKALNDTVQVWQVLREWKNQS